MKKLVLLFIIFSSIPFANGHQTMIRKKNGATDFVVNSDNLIPLHKDAIEKLIHYYENNTPTSYKVKILFFIDENSPEKLEYNVSYQCMENG